MAISVINGDAFLRWLHDAGIIPAETRRVVIDAEVGNIVIVYVEQFGTKKLIEVNPPPGLETAVVLVGEGDNGKPD